MLLRLGYLAVSNVFTALRLLPMADRDKDVEILVLRHQIAVLERQLGRRRVRFTASDRAFLAALLHRLPTQTLQKLRLVVRPDTVLRWYRNLIARRHAAGPSRSGQAGHRRCAPSAYSCCAWSGTTRAGDTGACTANCWSWA